jgi:hypothetical protein
MVDFFRPGLPVLLVVLPIVLAWRVWLNSDPKTLVGWRKPVFSTALYVASANVAMTSGIWFYFWATPFSGIEIIRLALLFGFPVSAEVNRIAMPHNEVLVAVRLQVHQVRKFPDN